MLGAAMHDVCVCVCVGKATRTPSAPSTEEHTVGDSTNSRACSAHERRLQQSREEKRVRPCVSAQVSPVVPIVWPFSLLCSSFRHHRQQRTFATTKKSKASLP